MHACVEVIWGLLSDVGGNVLRNATCIMHACVEVIWGFLSDVGGNVLRNATCIMHACVEVIWGCLSEKLVGSAEYGVHRQKNSSVNLIAR